MRIALIYADHLDAKELVPVLHKRIDSIETAMKRHSHDVTRIERCALPESLDDFDLVAAAGGDGTQLDAASRMTDTLLCAIRLFPEQSIGYHCTLDYDQFEDAIAQFHPEHAHIVEIPRLQCFIDGAPIPAPILNDALLAHACPARASRYILHFGDTHQRQCSSGIWIATQPGSHGAAKSAGATVLPDHDKNKAVFAVREIMGTDKLKSAVFHPGLDHFSIEICSSSLNLYFDGGLSMYPLKPGQMLTFGHHPNPLRKWITSIQAPELL